MKSGLEDRNNKNTLIPACGRFPRLNEVRPGRPEQWYWDEHPYGDGSVPRLNEVRPGRPEQFGAGSLHWP